MLGALVVLFMQLICVSAATAYSDQPIDRFEAEIKRFEAEDQVKSPLDGQTLFIGSSTFARWKTLEQDLSDLHPLNRGFGGATIPEINYYEKRLVALYHPARIVFYAGTNDIADGHSAEQVWRRFRSLCGSGA